MKLLALLLISTAANAEQCADHDTIRDGLASGYGEVRTAIGMFGPSVIEVFSNPETGTWTIVQTTAGGTSCMVGAGTGWRAVDEKPGIDG